VRPVHVPAILALALKESIHLPGTVRILACELRDLEQS